MGFSLQCAVRIGGGDEGEAARGHQGHPRQTPPPTQPPHLWPPSVRAHTGPRRGWTATRSLYLKLAY